MRSCAGRVRQDFGEAAIPGMTQRVTGLSKLGRIWIRRHQKQPRQIMLTELTAPRAALSRRKNFVLTRLPKEPALLLLKRCDEGNRLECCRVPHERGEQVTSSRPARMIHTVLRLAAFPTDLRGFETTLLRWEPLITKWETKAEDILSSAFEEAVLHATAAPKYHGICGPERRNPGVPCEAPDTGVRLQQRVRTTS